MNRNVLILAFCQAMLFTGTGLVISSSALIGADLAPSPAWATLPLALQYLTTTLLAYYFSQLMRRKGRRYVFVRGALLGMVGVGLAALGIWLHNFALFAGASLLIGMHTAIAQFYRFAAAEAVPETIKARAISLTLAGGIVAAFIGPNLAHYTRDLLAPAFFASFLLLILVTAAAAWMSSRLELPDVAHEQQYDDARPLLQIALQGKYIIAVLAAMVGYGVMNFLMVATPLAMQSHGCSFPSTTWVIQWHLVAMFAPSFVTGDIIRKLGVLPVMLAGCALIAACAVVNLSGTTVSHFETALILLGIGWNFLYIGATTFLTDTYTPHEKSRAQGLNDTLVFATLTLTSLASGAMISQFGWEAINRYSLIPVVLVGSLLVWLMLQSLRRKAVQAN